MITYPEKLKKGDRLKIEIEMVKDRLPKNLAEIISKEPHGELVGFKMVDGNQFGLVLKLNDASISWFFAEELSQCERSEEKG